MYYRHTERKDFSNNPTLSLGSPYSVVVYTVPILLGDIIVKTGDIEIFEFPIGYCGMPINRLLSVRCEIHHNNQV